MDSKIPEIPELPPEIIDAAKEDRLIIFVGTGPSISMGAADWNSFADNVLDQLISKQIIDYAFKDQISGLGPRKRLSIARSLAKDEGIIIDYEEAIMPAPEKESSSKVYDYLRSIGSHFVTTNYDPYLDQPKINPLKIESDEKEDETEDINIVYDPTEINKDTLEANNAVVHLHGSFETENSNNLVITTEDYLYHYYYENEKQKGIRNYLNELFGGYYTILFVGYGLQEKELLEYIIAKADEPRYKNKAKKQRRRFWLEGCFSHQKSTYQHLTTYYEENFDVHMILYSRDKNNFAALEDIIAKWSIQINNVLTPYTDKIKFINKVIGNE